MLQGRVVELHQHNGGAAAGDHDFINVIVNIFYRTAGDHRFLLAGKIIVEANYSGAKFHGAKVNEPKQRKVLAFSKLISKTRFGKR